METGDIILIGTVAGAGEIDEQKYNCANLRRRNAKNCRKKARKLAAHCS